MSRRGERAREPGAGRRTGRAASPKAAPPAWWRRVGPVVAVVGVGLALVFAVATPQPHTGGDNAGYLSLAHALVTGRGYVELWDPAIPLHTKYPPVFPLVLGALAAAGATTWTAFKLVPALAIVASAGLASAWAGHRLGGGAGAAVALLSLLSLGWLDASRWILSEPIFLAAIFLALWAAERGVPPSRLPGAPKPISGEESFDARWLFVAAVGTGLACFTRAAAAPLAAALVGVLLLGRRWRAAGSVGVGLALPAAWWWLRARASAAAGAYSSEFWMVDPYDPSLGTIDWLDLPVRAWRNLWFYVTEVLPAEWWPALGSVLAGGVGTALVAAAGTGWVLRIRDRGVGLPELFGPLYLGLILIWPEVWSGNRFALPLYPLLFVYATRALEAMGPRLGPSRTRAVLGVAALVVALPAVPRWLDLSAEGRACRSAVAARGDVFACHAPSFDEFRLAAAWSGANLPEGAVVLNRKPRLFFALGGGPGRVFPFTEDPQVFLAEAARAGARYVLMDHLDGVSLFYLPAVVRASPGAFCVIVGWGGDATMPGTLLLGILPEAERVGGPRESLAACPTSYLVGQPREPTIEGLRIPLLTRG